MGKENQRLGGDTNPFEDGNADGGARASNGGPVGLGRFALSRGASAGWAAAPKGTPARCSVVATAAGDVFGCKHRVLDGPVVPQQEAVALHRLAPTVVPPLGSADVAAMVCAF